MLLIPAVSAQNQTVYAEKPQGDSWLQIASMNFSRSAVGLAAVDGKIYAIGGTTSTGSITGTNEMYDPERDIWVEKAAMPTPREYFAIAAYQNKIYCIGGQTGWEVVDEISGFMHPVTSEVTEVYDTVTDTWTTKASVPGPAIHITAQEINAKIYITGVSNLLVYDVASDSWTITVPPLSLPYSDSPPASVAINGNIFITGEYFTRSIYQQNLYIYNIQNSSMTQGKAAPVLVTSCVVAATTGLKAPPLVYVLGLTSENYPPVSINQVYDPDADSWSLATAMPTNRTQFGVAFINDTFYAIGGIQETYNYDSTGKYIQSRDASPTKINELYIPIGYGTILPSPTVNPSSPSVSDNQQPSNFALYILLIVFVIILLVSLVALMHWKKA